MASIGAGTMHTMKKTKSKLRPTGASGLKTTVVRKTKGGAAPRGSVAPKMKPKQLLTPVQISTLKELDSETSKDMVLDYVRSAFGERSALNIGAPHTASTTMDRSRAAADVAIAARELGAVVVLKRFGVLSEVERMLIPEGIGKVFANSDGTTNGGGMKKIASAVSLMSLDSTDGTGSFTTNMTSESKRGKQLPPIAREGALLILRALCEVLGKRAEPFVVPLLAPTLDECSSSSSGVRTAAEDTSKAIISLASPHATPRLICPVIFAAIQSTEWRVKVNALDRLSQLATTAPSQVSKMLPEIIPNVTGVVWDTKPQVVKSAKACLNATCNTNVNPDIKPAIPAIVNAIVKPVTETTKAIDELMATTFVATVDSSTLAILCPVLSRGLREKMLAVQKRAVCLVIQNMSRLVETPDAVAPFGPLLVPDLKKVAENVQFEEIRDAALAALQTLTKALGHASIEDAVDNIMAEESRRIKAEQKRIEEERAEEQRKEDDIIRREEAERRLWKEAMEAQRLLDKIAEQEEVERKTQAAHKKELAKTKVKYDKGKCQGCGLKKCKKTCLFAD